MALLSGSVLAQGTAFTYQGRLNDGAIPANEIYDLRFTIYDTVTNGAVQGGPITNSPTSVSNGLFTVTLEFGAGVFTGPARWLEIGVRTNGGAGAYQTLNPRQQITSAPYAIMASNAEVAATATSVPAANISGMLSLAQLPGAVLTNNAAGVSLTGSFTGNGGGMTNVPGAFPEQLVGGSSAQASPNMGYATTGSTPATITLPVTANVGDVVQVFGLGAGGWQVTGNISGQQPAGSLWTAHETNRHWTAVASSADGSKLVAVDGQPASAPAIPAIFGDIHTSTDGGVTWTARNVTNIWSALASSADGNRLAAIGSAATNISSTLVGLIYVSSDAGATWIARAFSNQWTAVASSADGIKLVAVSRGSPSVYTSIDGGTNWTAHATGATNLGGPWVLASSTDGSKLVAANNPNASHNGFIYTSTDSGTNWTRRANANGWVALASSSDGSRLVALDLTGLVYTSVDSGTNWTAQGIIGASVVASSADGGRLVAASAVNLGQIYISTDGGTNWTAHESNRVWAAVASSADGNRLVAADNYGSGAGGQIYTSSGPQFAGAQGSMAEFQYAGSGVWQPVSLPQQASNAPNTAVVRDSNGAVTATAFVGDASSLTGINAANITSGTLSDGRLSANVALRAGGNAFTGDQTITAGNVGIGKTNPATALDVNGTATATAFSGNGSGLTGIPLTALASAPLTNGQSGVTLSGAFSGNGSALTNVSGSTAANYVYCYTTTNFTPISTGTFDVPFNTDAALSGWTHTLGSATYTNAQSGLYLIQYTGQAQVNGSGNSASMQALINGSVLAGSQAGASLSASGGPMLGSTISKSFIASFNSGDVLKLQLTVAFTTGGVSLTSNFGNPVSMTIIRIQ